MGRVIADVLPEWAGGLQGCDQISLRAKCIKDRQKSYCRRSVSEIKKSSFSSPRDQFFLAVSCFRKMEVLSVVPRRAKKGSIPHGSAADSRETSRAQGLPCGLIPFIVKRLLDELC